MTQETKIKIVNEFHKIIRLLQNDGFTYFEADQAARLVNNYLTHSRTNYEYETLLNLLKQEKVRDLSNSTIVPVDDIVWGEIFADEEEIQKVLCRFTSMSSIN